MNILSEWIEQNLSIPPETQVKLFSSLVVLVILWIARWLVLKQIGRRTEDPAFLYRWRKATEYITYFLGLLLIGRIWIEGVQSAATYLGLLTAGLAIALQDPIADIVGWLFIIWRQPFEVGDRIEIGDHAGDVIDIRFFQFTILEIGNWVEADQSTGRMLHIPNKLVFSDSLANYTTGFSFIWHEIPVVITFESDWRKAKEILLEIVNKQAGEIGEEVRRQVKEAARHYMISYSYLTPIVYTRVLDSGVSLTIRYTCDPRQRRSTEEKMWEEILKAFADHADIDFAYPTQRIFYQPPAGEGTVFPKSRS